MKSRVLTLAVLTLTGCGSFGPSRDVHSVDLPPVPSEWTAEQPGSIESDLPVVEWSELLGDDRASEIVSEALRSNPSAGAALARVEQAAARARIAGADVYPQISTSLDVSERKQNFVGFPLPGAGEDEVFSTTTTTWGLGLNVTWEADLWGRLRARKSASEHEFEASLEDYRAALLSLSGQALKSWLLLLEAEQQLTLSRETVANRTEILERIERRYAGGLVRALDVRLAKTNLAASLARVAAWELQRDAAARRLETMLGRYPAGEVETDGILPPGDGAILPGDPVEVLSRRPDLRAAENRLLASDDRVFEARAVLYPQLRLSGSYGTFTDEAESLLDSDYSIWSVAAGLLQPLFQGGRLRANVDLNEAFRDEAEARFAESFLRSAFEVEQALFAEAALARQERALAEAVENARGAEVSARERYLAGLIDYLVVLESERQALETESQLLEARRRRLETRVDLGLALGGPVVVAANEDRNGDSDE